MRLNTASWALAAVEPEDATAQEAIMRIFELGAPALENLKKVVAVEAR